MAVNPDTPIVTSSASSDLSNANDAIMNIIKNQQQLDRYLILKELLKIEDLDITIAGEKQKVLNLELITEYPNANYVKTLTKNETWRESCRQNFHLRTLNDEKIIGTMDTQFMLKMVSHRRKRSQEVVNALKNEVAGTEVIPSKTRTKRFFGMV